MKAAQFSRFGGPEVLEIVDLSIPIPAPGKYASRSAPPGSTPATGRSDRA